MTGALPDYFFRVRENGATVFRVESDARTRRIEMDPIAVVNTRKGEIRPQGQRELSEDDIEAIIRAVSSEPAAGELEAEPNRALDRLPVGEW